MTTAQPPLRLVPDGARPVGAAVAIVEDDDGGRVYVHGNLAYAWDAGDAAGRRFAAVSLTRIKAATQLQVAAAFAVNARTLRRWEIRCSEAGVPGLLTEGKGPKRKSTLTPDTVAAIRRLREGGASYRTVAATVGVSLGSVRNALAPASADVDRDPCAPSGSGVLPPSESEPGSEPQPRVESEPAVETDAEVAAEEEVGAEHDCPATPLAEMPLVDATVSSNPVPQAAERVSVRFEMIAAEPPRFTPCARAPLAGLLLALPALTATGLAETAHEIYGEYATGFHSLDTMLCEMVFRALLGEARAGGAARVDPVALGRVLGLHRAPEVKTIRSKVRLLAEVGKAGDWIAAMARRHLQARPEQVAVCYVGGHVRAYQGTRDIAKTHVPRLKFPAPATVETWVSDAAGDPLLVVMAEPAASLASELRRMIPDLRALIGDDRRMLVGFDRGGWSPALFAELDAAGFDILTWRMSHAADIDQYAFADHGHRDEHGRVYTWCLADTEAKLTIDDGPRKGEVFPMRQISLFESTPTRQMHILTTRRDLPAAEISYRMGSCWRQENHYRYRRVHLDLDSDDRGYDPLAGGYRAVNDNPNRTVPNPAKKIAYQHVEKGKRATYSAEAFRDRELLAAELDAARAAQQAIAARLPLAQVNHKQQVLDTETKLIHHAIRMAAYNATRSLARAIVTDTGYTRADEEAHNLIRAALAGSGDIIADHHTLHIRLDPLSAPCHTAAIAELCRSLNTTDTVYPGTTLTLRYSVKPHRPPDTSY